MPTATRTKSPAKKASSSKKSTSTNKAKKEEPAAPKYGQKGYAGKQPFEQGGPRIKPAHQKSTLGSGSAGAQVLDLAQLLHKLGYPTDISEGRNSFCVLGSSELAAVEAFRRDYGVQEDPSGFRDERAAAKHVGVWTWEALLRATGRV